MASTPSTRAQSGRNYVRPVGRGDFWVGVAVTSLVLIFCTALAIRGLAPRGTLWGAAEPIFVGVGATQAAGLSGGSMSMAAIGTMPEAMVTPGTPPVAVPSAPGAPGATTPSAPPDGAQPTNVGGDGVARPIQVPSAPAGRPGSGGGSAGGSAPGAAPPPGGGGAAKAPAGGDSGARPASGPQAFLPVKAPAGYTAGAVQKFNAANLYEKINGKADSYLDYGFVGLESMSLTQADSNIDVYIYDMGNPLQAFGMLNSERSGTTPVAVGQDGYTAGGSVFFRADRYYTMIMVSKPTAQAAATEVAKELAGKMPKTQFTPPGIAWFPKDGLVAGSVKWVMKKVGGVEGLDDGYVAAYKQGNDTVDVFMVRRADAGALKQAYDKYLAYLKSAGTVNQVTIAGTAVQESLTSSGDADTLFQKGQFIGGTMYVPAGKAAAEAVTGKLIGAIK